MAHSMSRAEDLKHSAGIGLRHVHLKEVLRTKPKCDWLEVHSENFMMPGGAHIDQLKEIRKHYQIALHGVNLSLGSADGLDLNHLKRLKELLAWVKPCFVSEHLSWGRIGPNYLNDLLPIPYTKESFLILRRNIDLAQNYLGLQLFIENPSSYMEYNSSTIPEAEFMNELCAQSGSKILCDVNNIYVSCENHGWNSDAYLAKLSPDLIGEIHLAGHSLKEIEGQTLRLDDHGSHVCPEVWELYKKVLAKFGPVPTLIEWDTNIPPLAVLVEEAQKAQYLLNQAGQGADRIAC